MPVIDVYEVYSEGGSNCVLFLTEQEARTQTMIAPYDGPYRAKVDLTEEEISTLDRQRHLWAYYY